MLIPFGYQSWVIEGLSLNWVAALEVRALDVWTTSLQGEDGDLVLLLKQEGGRGQRHDPGSLRLPGGSQSAMTCRLISSWESTR